MTQDTESLQPWQIFCSMFAVFWLVSAWCDQVIISLVLCIVFGVISDIVTKNMYSAAPSKTEPEKEKEINVEEVKASNEKIWKKAEAELDEVADVPPPLPDKDYKDSGNIDSLADKLQALAATEDIAFAEESDEDEERPEPSRQYNRTVSDEYNQNTSAINFNKESIIEEEVAEVTAEDQDSDESEEEKKVYAKDSSDEDDYDYASREVNFDESETDGEADEDTDDVKDTKPAKAVKDSSDDE